MNRLIILLFLSSILLAQAYNLSAPAKVAHFSFDIDFEQSGDDVSNYIYFIKNDKTHLLVSSSNIMKTCSMTMAIWHYVSLHFLRRNLSVNIQDLTSDIRIRIPVKTNVSLVTSKDALMFTSNAFYFPNGSERK